MYEKMYNNIPLGAKHNQSAKAMQWFVTELLLRSPVP